VVLPPLHEPSNTCAAHCASLLSLHSSKNCIALGS
jgi:hypothetical protein